MTEVYVIQSGDTLTKIAKEKYGLSGNAAYQKALEIARENGIENPNLIYAGSTLNLNGLGDDAPEPAGDNFTTQDAVQDNVENTYNNLFNTQRQYMRQLAGLNEDGKTAPTSFKIADLDENSTEEDYMNAIYALADQDIAANDKADENGVKDGVIDYDEFAAQQIAFYRSTYDDYNTSDEELEQLMGLRNIFNMQDVDGSGVLERNEIAFAYMAADINFDSSTFSTQAVRNLDGYAEFDGIIDFEQMSIAAQMFNDDMLQGGNTYANIYNKMSYLFTGNTQNTENTGATRHRPRPNELIA